MQDEMYRLISERGLLRRRLLFRPSGQHNSVRALHARYATAGRVFGDSGSAVARVGQIREHGALRLSEHANPGIRRRRADRSRKSPPEISVFSRATPRLFSANL